MSFTRRAVPLLHVEAAMLTASMVGIGMNFAAAPIRDPNIEDTILLASIEGIEKDDLRVLAVLVTWFGIHSPFVNADRLTNLVAGQTSPRVRALWSALALWRLRDRRFSRLKNLYVGPRQDLTEIGTEFQVARHGEDVRFDGSAIRVAANTLRDRVGDVLHPSELARKHGPYRYRIMMGPSFRADMWAALEADPTLSPAALARKAYGSFSTAWHVRRDFGLLAGTSFPASGSRTNHKKPPRSA